MDHIDYFAPQITILCIAIGTCETRTTSLFGWGCSGKWGHTGITGFRFKFTFYQWTIQRIHNTLIVVDRYLPLMGDKMIIDSEKPCLESFYPIVADIDLPHQGVLDSWNHYNGNAYIGKSASLYRNTSRAKSVIRSQRMWVFQLS